MAGILLVARNELRCILRDGRFRGACLLLAALVCASLLALREERARDHAERSEARQRVRALWLDQGDADSHGATHYGTYAFKPVTRLSAFDSGVEPYAGVYAHLESHAQNEFAARPARDAGPLARFGGGSPAALLLLLLPLLAIFLGHGAVATERENGLLRFALSGGCTPRQWLWGKFLGVWAALMLLATPVLAACMVVLGALEGEESTADHWLRSSLLAAAICASLAIHAGLSVGLSARMGGSRSALLALLCLWLVGAVFAPRVATELGERIWPTPDNAAFDARHERLVAEGVDGHDARNERTRRLREEILRRHGVASEKDLPFNIGGVIMQAGEDYSNQVFDKLHGELWGGWRAQNALRDAAALLSPLPALRRVSKSLCGTDLEHHLAFVAQAEAYRRELVRAMNDALARQGPDRRSATAPRGRALWESVPDLRTSQPSVASALRWSLPGLVGLAFWLVAALLLVGLPWRPRAN